jgi:hypothetical protein
MDRNLIPADAINAAALKMSATRQALLMLAGDPYGENGDFNSRVIYDTLPANAIRVKFFSVGEGPTKGRHLTNLEGNGQLPEGQSFAANHCAIRIMPISTGVLTDGDTDAIMAELSYHLQMCYFEPTLAGKDGIQTWPFSAFMATNMVRPAAGAVGVPPSMLFAENWQYFEVPYKVPQLTTHGVLWVKGDGVDWSANIKNKFQIAWLWRTVFARRT